MIITAEIAADVENGIANLMAQYRSLNMSRYRTIDNYRDGLATVIADDVAAGITPHPTTVAKYAYLTELWHDQNRDAS